MSANPAGLSPLRLELLRAASAVDAEELVQSLDRLVAGGGIDELGHADAELLPLIHRRIESLGVRHDVAPVAARAYKRNWLKNQQMVFAVMPLVQHLQSVGSAPIVLKGGAMVTTAYYDDLGARPFYDIDLLIETEHVDTAIDFALGTDWSVVGGKTVEEYRAAHHAIDLRRGDIGAMDLHWELLSHDRSPDRTRRLFERAVPALLGGHDVRVLAPTDHLFHTIAHSKPEGFRHIADAVTILRARPDEIEWNVLLDESVARRELSSALRSLEQVEAVHGGLVPSAVLAELARADRHWSDYVFAGESVGSRRAGLRRFAADWSGRSRGAGPVEKLRIARILMFSYGESSGLGVRKKLASFAVKGPTTAKPPAEPPADPA